MEDKKEGSEKWDGQYWSLFILICCILAVNVLPWRDNATPKDTNTRKGKDKYALDLKEWVKRVQRSQIRPLIFVESSFKSSLTIRQACTVESAARWNPDHHILLIMTSPPRDDQPLVQILRNRFAVHVLHTDPQEIFKGSPLESWYRGWSHNDTDIRTVHLSDAMRLTLLWHLGGIYLDLDIVVQRPLDILQNAILTESENYLCNAVMAFDPHHEFVEECLLDFARNYSGDTWIANGPELVTRVAHRYCGVNHTDRVNEQDCDLNVLPVDVGYALEWPKWKWFFQVEHTREIMELTNNSLLIHLWNSQSRKWTDRVGSGSTMDLLFSKHCPVTYKQVVDRIF